MSLDSLKSMVEGWIQSGKTALNEWEGYHLLQKGGIATPSMVFLSREEWRTGNWSELHGSQLVLKIMSRNILHKSDWGGVAFLDNDVEQVRNSMETMAARVMADPNVLDWDGFLIMERLDFENSLGHEWLLSFQQTRDFGPVVVLGPGGIYTEYLAKSFHSDHMLSVFTKAVHPDLESIEATLKKNALFPLVGGGLRGQKARVDVKVFAQSIYNLLNLGSDLADCGLNELEINPLVVHDGVVVALDSLVKLKTHDGVTALPRPIEKIDKLLKPQKVALIGVSEKMNPGKIILLNMLQCGFQKENIFIIKPGTEQIEGVRCVPAISELPVKVDLMVLSVSAQQVPDIMDQIIQSQKVESVILIPGGLEEKEGTQHLVQRMKEQLRESRKTDWKGPVINGGNCVGVRSGPGKYDTLFIPRHKLASAGTCPTHLALVSQSGAYLVSLLDRLTDIAPVYSISLGNQSDLTIADYLEYLNGDPDINVFGIYCEGLKPGDGERLLKMATLARSQGKRLVFYHAGKTPEGAAASASHTASVAGNYKIFKALATEAGILVAESLADFEDLMMMAHCFEGVQAEGLRLAALSNAGFECVAMADNLGPFQFASFQPQTEENLQGIFEKARISEIVDVHNPLDLTPMMGDEGYADVMKSLLQDDNVDAAVFGVVPLTPALNTLASSDSHRENIETEDSIVQRMIQLRSDSKKPFIAVVDAGKAYSPMKKDLGLHQIPVFDKMDRAMRLLGQFFHR